ncbi:TonB-dependent receptor SusC [termite gut metagenome]|uniref:TonB-dependent receptor SusC n=1 Tax=termite gut metagenome TaxID=433724 RepID=A0A5J4SIJ3_9ZZZZ
MNSVLLKKTKQWLFISKFFLNMGICIALFMGGAIQVVASNDYPQKETAVNLQMQQQSKTITGQVVDGTGEPIIGANVLEKGTSNGRITDLDGKFTLTVGGNAILTVSCVGYSAQNVPTAGKTQFTITMIEDVRSLDEVVVVGYGTVKKSDLTGAVAKVSTDDLLQLSTTDIGQALAGRVAGVDIISNSGEPGAGVKIRIRGYGTINTSDPLYVVDGFPVSNIDHISPQDIESLEILKDASATAIYGSRGANGVVLIQTKRGKPSKKPSLSVNIYGSMSDIYRTIDLLNAWEFATIKRESWINGGATVTPVADAMFQYLIDNKLKGTNWVDEVTRIGYTQNYNLNLNGGGDQVSYDIGVTYSNQEGIVKYNNMNFFSARANNTYKVTKDIQLGMNLTYTRRERIGTTGGNYYGGLWPTILGADPTVPAWDSYTNNWGEILYSDTNYQPARAAYESGNYGSGISHMFMGNISLQINNIGLKGLSFRAQYGTRAGFDDSISYSPIYYISANQLRQRSSLNVSRPRNSSWLGNAYFMYNNTFNKIHNLGATLGTEWQKSSSSSFSANANDVPEAENMWYLSQTADKTSYSASHSGSITSIESFFFRSNYSYANKYLLTGTIRADGSSRFIKKWGYFPSFSLGWNAHEENFVKNSSANDLLSQLKLRVGWGMVGNESSAGANDYIALMTTGYTYVFGGQVREGAIQQAYANDQLTWEAAEQLNLGLDFGLWNMKLSGTIDYFVRTTRDMILAVPIPIYTGMWRTRTNSGEMRNNGLEITLKYQNKIGGLTYALSGNMSLVKNKILELGSDDPIYGDNVGRINTPFTRTEKGREMAYFYGYKTDGIFQTQEEINNYAYTDEQGNKQLIQPNAQPGDVKFVKTANDGKALNETDRTYLGSAMPDASWGFNINLGYKNFDFAVFLQGVWGNEIANAKVQDLYSSNMVQWNMSKDMMKRWTSPGSTNKYPRVTSADPNQNSRFSDRYIYDGTYTRIKNVQLGYTLPKNLISKVGLKRLRFYASVDNLWVFSDYNGFDPEMGDYLGNPLQNGVDMVSYPRPRTTTFGLNLTF